MQDLLLPRSLTSRLARGVLPPNTSLQKDAILALTRSATVFISYLASHANEQSQLRHRKTMAVQDVYAALREIEFSGQMELGAVGEDGRLGGRLEREVELYEEGVLKKRRGYREKVKMRESGGAGDEEVDGEPSSKKARRTSEREEDEEQRMLEQQLNGMAEAGASGEGQERDAQRSNGEATGFTVVVPNGHAKEGQERASPPIEEEELMSEPGDVDEGPGAEEEEDQDDEEEDEEDDEEDETQQQDDDHDADEIDDARLTNGHGRGLLPNGEVEIGSDEESD